MSNDPDPIRELLDAMLGDEDSTNPTKDQPDPAGFIFQQVTGEELVDIMGYMTVSSIVGEAFAQSVAAQQLLFQACKMAAKLSDERRDRLADRLGMDFRKLRIAGLKSSFLVEAIYKAAEPGAGPDGGKRFAKVMSEMSRERDKFRSLTDDL